MPHPRCRGVRARSGFQLLANPALHAVRAGPDHVDRRRHPPARDADHPAAARARNRQINERLRTLIAAYKVLGSSFTGDLAVDPTHQRDLRQRAAEAGEDAEAAEALAAGSDRSRRIRDAVENRALGHHPARHRRSGAARRRRSGGPRRGASDPHRRTGRLAARFHSRRARSRTGAGEPADSAARAAATDRVARERRRRRQGRCAARRWSERWWRNGWHGHGWHGQRRPRRRARSAHLDAGIERMG